MPASTTTRKPATSDKPANVSINLDTLEREGGEPEPFVFVLGGDRFVCADIEGEDWKALMDISEDDPKETFTLLLGKDYEKFAKHKLPLWKLKALMKAWRDHTGALDMGDPLASSTS